MLIAQELLSRFNRALQRKALDERVFIPMCLCGDGDQKDPSIFVILKYIIILEAPIEILLSQSIKNYLDISKFRKLKADLTA